MRDAPRWIVAVAALGVLLMAAAGFALEDAASSSRATVHATEVPALLRLAFEHAWAGRSTQAIQLFDAVTRALEGQRDSTSTALAARAWSGRGDVLRWSDRDAESLAAYERAAALAPQDATIGGVRNELRARAATQVTTSILQFDDSSKLVLWSTSVALDAGPACARAWLADVEWQEMQGAAATTAGMRARVGGRRLVAPGWTLATRIGGTRFATSNAELDLETTLARRGGGLPSLDLTYAFGERGTALHSLAARQSGLTGHELRLSGYKGFGSDRGVWFQVHGGRLSDSNQYAALDASWEFRPLPRTVAQVVLAASDFAHPSETYYAPRHEWALGGAFETMLLHTRRSEARLQVNCGRAGNSGTQGIALALRASATRRMWHRVAAIAHFEYEQSIQRTTYIARQARVELQWRP